jgi:hypothetical protein
MIKAGMRWEGLAARMGKMRNIYMDLVKNLKGYMTI